MRGKRTWQFVLVLTLFGLWVLESRTVRSDNNTPSAPGSAANVSTENRSGASASLSPAETVRTLQRLHNERNYEAIAPLVVAKHRTSFVRLIRAADAVIDANTRLKTVAESRFGGPMGEAWDLSSMQNNLGPLSKDLVLINQRFRGDTAVVTLQEGDYVPLVRAAFRCVEGVWQYDPESVPDQVADELLELACLVSDVESEVRGGAPFEVYFDSFMQRILPQMARVATINDGAETSVASSVSMAK